jgi:cytochrome P450
VTAVSFSPFSRSFRHDPYPAYAALRATAPVHRERNLWILTGAAEIKAVMSDLRFSSGAIRVACAKSSARMEPGVFDELAEVADRSIVFTDRPAHTRLRRLVGQVIHPRSLEQRRTHVEQRVEHLLDDYSGCSSFDFMELADALPLAVISDLFAVPAEMRPTLRRWTHEVRHMLEPMMMSPRVLRAVRATLSDYIAYCAALIEERRSRPGDDIVSKLLAARHGDDRLSNAEIGCAIIMTFVAGHETSRALLGNGLLALLEHPEQLRLLRASPALLPNAVQEMIRYDSPLQMTQRLATEDIRALGVDIARDDVLLLCLGAANRDPELNEKPESFRVDREKVGHLSFGHGIHNCLGGMLATLEAETLFASILRRWSSIERASASLEWQSESAVLRGLERFPIAVRG